MAGVPDWKKAIFDRRKKAEDDEKKKHEEEEAYLATLPPWKRALVQKRERERQQLEREKAEVVSSGAAVERNNSFQNTQQQKSVSSHPTQGWNRRVTPPSSKGRDQPTSPTSPSSSSGHFFSSADASSQQKQSRELNRRRSSVTALPGVDEPIASKIAAQSYTSTTTAKNEPVGVTLHGPHRQRSASESKKVVSSVKKLNVQSQQTSEMPAWKKALLERKKGRAPGGVGGSKPPQKPTSIDSQSLSMTRTDSPPEGSVNSDGSQNDTTSAPPPLRRTPSPSENSYNTKPATLGLQRMPSPPVEGEDRASTSNSGGHSDRKSLGLARTPSPVETLGAKFEQMQKKKPSESVGAVSASERKPASGVASGAAEARGKSSKSVPARSAPVAPSAASSSSSSKRMPTSHPKPQHSKQQTSTAGGVRMQPRPTPEVVNRGGNKESTTIQQSEAIRSEGVKHRAPVYKEVLTEWADVSEEDKKFRNLPPWKQALIRRRRADIAKRMGHTTSVDDVSLTNSQVPIEQEKKPDIPSGNRTAGAPSWKKQAPKPEETMKYSIAEKKQTSSRMEPSSNSNVKALLGRFSKPAPAPPPSTAVPKVTVSRSSRSPSPSSVPSTTSSTTSSSHPQPSTTTTTTTSTAAPTRSGTKKSFTWTPGEDTMPGEALSDDSSEEEDDEEGEGEYTVTNLDDTSDDEEEEEEGGEEDGGGGVVLLQPPKIFASTSSSSTPSIAATTHVEEDSSKKVRKTSSILAPINRSKRKPLRRVAFSETDLTVEHYYPKYDYSDYEEIQNDAVSTGFSFSFWKSRETVEATDSADKQNGLSQRLHPSLRSPESDPDNYRYSPSRESTQPGHTPPISSVKTATVTLSTYKPSILSGYGTDESLQQSYTNALENGTRDEGEGDEEMEVGGDDVTDGSDHLMPSDGVPNFYASLSSDDAAMLW